MQEVIEVVRPTQIVVSAGTAFKMGFYGLIGSGAAYLVVLLIPTVLLVLIIGSIVSANTPK